MDKITLDDCRERNYLALLMTPPTATATQRLTEMVLEQRGLGTLEEFVRSRRAEAPPRPWRLIVRDLYELTDREVDLAFETLRGWFPDEDRAEPTEASA